MAKKEDLNLKEEKELKKQLDEIEKKVFEAKNDLAVGKAKDLHLPRKLRKEISKIKTALRIKEIA